MLSSFTLVDGLKVVFKAEYAEGEVVHVATQETAFRGGGGTHLSKKNSVAARGIMHSGRS